MVLADLLILAGTFSDDMITTGMSFNEDDPCTPRIKQKLFETEMWE